MAELQREYDDTVKATLADTNAAAQKWARPEKASFVLVGDYSKIGPGLWRSSTSARSCCSTPRAKPVKK